MESNTGKLVSFRTIEGFEVIGLLFTRKDTLSDILVIHIHGNFGNFYQNKFLWVMSHMYVNNGVDFLTINLSSHDGLAEGYYGKELAYIGGAVADFNNSQKDIDAAIRFAKGKGYQRIILQGHSLGCDKVIQYNVERPANYPLILLSPVDSYKVQSEWIFPETVEEQIARLKKCVKPQSVGWGKADFDWLSSREYGAEGDTAEWTYEIPISRDALLSILTGAAFKYLNILSKNPLHIHSPVFAFVGKRDGLQMHDNTDWVAFLNKSFSSLTLINDYDADHDICGLEEELCEHIVQWITTL